ncbi:hypothetical protein DFH09DRAFT_1309422 [Mycena vulgaris]|nr:hypothetical protein DFH09DRAFT_1309422 [Mycena vulgaris]
MDINDPPHYDDWVSVGVLPYGYLLFQFGTAQAILLLLLLLLLRQIQYLNLGPIRDYTFFSSSGPQSILVTDFLVRLIFRLACQIAICTGDLECVALLSEVLFPLYSRTLDAFVEQFSTEYAVDAVSVFETAQWKTARDPFRRLVTYRWRDDFLNSEYGSCYKSLEKVSETTVSVELTREVIHSLRQWKESR